MLLAGDIGGTKTALAIFSPDEGPHAPLAEEAFPSARYPSLEALASEFLAQTDLPVNRASFGVSGPVAGGEAAATNLPWKMDEARLGKALSLRSVRLLNDLEAIARAAPFLGSEDLHTLNAGTPDPEGALAVIAPGTGLGEAFLTREGSGYRAHPSEGGHVDFAPTGELELGLLRHLLDRFGHASYERVCSGQGLPNIYEYLKEIGHAEEPSWLAEKLAAEDPTPIIVEAASDPDAPCELCVAALDIFVSALGAQAGNLALTVMATGGVFLGGGMPPRVLPVLERGYFMEAFGRKGRFSGLLGRVPVHVILNPKVALIGAARYGLEIYGDNLVDQPTKGS
jgi:glucokinase